MSSVGQERLPAHAAPRFYYARRAFRFLEFYRTLSSSQREHAFAAAGLSLQRMTPVQREAFLHLAVLHDGRAILDRLPQLRLSVVAGPGTQVKKPDGPWLLSLMFTCAPRGRGTPLTVACPTTQKREKI